jgi:spore coat protein A
MRDFAFRAARMDGGHGWLIGGRPFDPARTDVTVRVGDLEVWRLVADVYHPVHLHLVGFRVLSRSGRAPPPRRRPQGHHLATTGRVGGDPHPLRRLPRPLSFHCHNAEHEDMGMMANLEIT